MGAAQRRYGIDLVEKARHHQQQCRTVIRHDLPLFAGNMSGNMKGRYSVRPTANWRVTFGWQSDNAVDVDLEDCH